MHNPVLSSLEQTRFYRRFFKLTALNILANITVPLVSLVDVGMLGHLPQIHFLAGVALASILFDYIYWTFGFLRMGTTGITAQEVGKGDTLEVYRVLYRSLFLALGVSIFILIAYLPLREAGFLLLSGAPEVKEAGRAYFDARIWGAPAALCNFAFLGWYLGRERSDCVLFMTIVANAGNIFLNYLFIIRMELAATGAGLASMLSQYLMLMVAVMIFLRLGQRGPLYWKEVMAQEKVLALFKLNRDILLRTLCLISAFAVFTNFSSTLGTQVLAANAILLRLLTFASYLIDGVAFATESLVGVLSGAGSSRSLNHLVKLALGVGEACALLFLVILYLFSHQIFGLLTSHTDVLELTVRYSGWLVPVLVFGALAYIYDGLFIGATAGKPLRNWTIFSTVVVFLPVSLLGLHSGSNHLLWMALVVFMVARAGTLWKASGPLLKPVQTESG